MTSTQRLGVAVVVLGSVLWFGGGRDEVVRAQEFKDVKKTKAKTAETFPTTPPPSAPQPLFKQVFSAANRFSFSIDPNEPLTSLLPTPPKTLATGPAYLNDDLALVPEVAIQEPLAPSPNALQETAHTMAKISHINKGKTDAFMEAMIASRPDLAGMPFTLGDACRMKPARTAQFTHALGRVRQNMSMQVQIPVSEARNAPQRAADAFWSQFHLHAAQEDQATQADRSHQDDAMQGRIAALMQVLGPESPEMRMGLVRYLAVVPHREATRSLAKLAIFSTETEVRSAAVEALKVRRDKDYTDIMLDGLRYPWPAVAERASEAMVKLERTDLVSRLVEFLAEPDPRAPVVKTADGKQVHVAREVVRINHHRNCMLCHAPNDNVNANVQSGTVLPVPTLPAAGFSPGPNTFTPFTPPPPVSRAMSSKGFVVSTGMTAQVPIPGSPMPQPSQGYDNSIPDILVRIDVTYLRQDFSLMQKVDDASPWPALQRFDFLVRNRTLTDAEAKTQREELQKREANGKAPFRDATLAALRGLTNRDAEPTPAAWRRVLSLPDPAATRQ